MHAEGHDSELADSVASAQNGEPAALELLLARHLPNLEAFVRIRADTLLIERESIHDVVQSVCREALADLHSIEYRGDAAFRSWLYLLASRKIIDRYRGHRRQRRDVAREVGGDSLESTRALERFGSTLTPSRVASAQEEARRIERALQELPESQRDAVTYSKLLGLNNSSIAKQLGVSESAVRNLIARGLAKLSDTLARS